MADLTPEGSFAAWFRKEVPPGTVIGNPDWWAPRIWRAVERARLAQQGGDELARLREFAAWVMEAHTGSIEGWEIQEKAVELGLMEEVLCDGSCEDCCGAIPGEDTCCRPLLSPTAPPTASPETDKGGEDG